MLSKLLKPYYSQGGKFDCVELQNVLSELALGTIVSICS